MTEEQRIKEIYQEMNFLKQELEELLLESGIVSNRHRLAIWTNIKRIEKLDQELKDLEK